MTAYRVILGCLNLQKQITQLEITAGLVHLIIRYKNVFVFDKYSLINILHLSPETSCNTKSCLNIIRQD